MSEQHKIKPLPYAYNLLKGISEQVNKWHHDIHYAGYVNKRNEIETALQMVDKSKANANYSEFAALKRHETFNANGMILHEIYWDMLGGDGTTNEHLHIEKQIVKDFGSFDKWKEDFIACGKIALGWVVLAYDPSDNKLHNYTGDSHNQGGVWGAVPLIAMDVFEHAYYHDYGPDRATYLNAYFNNIKWDNVEKKFKNFVK